MLESIRRPIFLYCASFFTFLFGLEFIPVALLIGEIKVRQLLDYEVTSTYTLSVIAYDSGVPSLSSTATVYINVEDVNDHEPYITYTTAEEDNRAKVRQIL